MFGIRTEDFLCHIGQAIAFTAEKLKFVRSQSTLRQPYLMQCLPKNIAGTSVVGTL